MMLKRWMLALGVGCLAGALSTSAVAQEQAGQGATTPKVQVSVNGYWIGPDGKKHELGSDDVGEGIEALPEALRGQIEKMLEEAKAGDAGQPVHVKAFGKMIVIGPGGEKTVTELGGDNEQDIAKMREQVLNSLPENVGDDIRAAIKNSLNAAGGAHPQHEGIMTGKMIVVGPDGKKQEFDFGKGEVMQFQFPFGKMFGAGPAAQPETDRASDSVSAKLDLILERLEKLEARVDGLSQE